MRWVMAGIVACVLASSAEALEVWLASTENCNSCALYERVAQQRGYGSALRYADPHHSRVPSPGNGKNGPGEGQPGPLPEGGGPGRPAWGVALAGAGGDAGRVVTSGNF